MQLPKGLGHVSGLGVALAVALTLATCTTSPQGKTGTLKMTLVDAPILGADVDAVTITVSRVEVHRETAEDEPSSGWIEVGGDEGSSLDVRTFNLLELVGGVEALLGTTELEAGTYTQIRLFVDDATITTNGEEVPLRIPSAEQTGIKLIHPFEIRPDELTELTLDFDVERSVHEAPPGSGNFMMRPTIRVVQTALSGSVAGVVSPAGVGAVVNVYEAGTTNLVTTAHVDEASGAYAVRGLLAGTYDIQVVADGFVTASRTGVTVVAGTESGGLDFTLARV
jgi:hypothetical protein